MGDFWYGGDMSARMFFGRRGTSLVASATPGSALGTVAHPHPAPPTAAVTSEPVQIRHWNATGAVSYAWARLSGDAAINVQIQSTVADRQTVNFHSPSVPLDAAQSAVFRCTVTDANTSVVVDVPVELSYFTST